MKMSMRIFIDLSEVLKEKVFKTGGTSDSTLLLFKSTA